MIAVGTDIDDKIEVLEFICLSGLLGVTWLEPHGMELVNWNCCTTRGTLRCFYITKSGLTMSHPIRNTCVLNKWSIPYALWMCFAI